MKNFTQEGDTLSLTAPYEVASGAGMLIGSIFAVATSGAANGAAVEGFVGPGVVSLAALSTDTGTVGALMYWDNTNKRLTATASGNTKVGVLTVAKANGETTATVRLSAAF